MSEFTKYRLRPVEESDIKLLYEMLREFMSISNTSINNRPFPSYEESKKFVLKYLYDNENHEYDKWYIVIDECGTAVGNVYITDKNYVSYHILKLYCGKGIGIHAVRLLMKSNPRNRYFAVIHEKNEKSLNLIKKLGFHPKAIVFEKIIEE